MFSSEEKNFRQQFLERADQNKLKIDNLPLIGRFKSMYVIKKFKSAYTSEKIQSNEKAQALNKRHFPEVNKASPLTN
ncbi:MAG: hypothetical protein AAY43_11660 [Methanosarcina sp. 795]|jgi:hypothetical protein|nr:MAG: hypothetical protein AAY43_11660 [Methanosarcina sp. 795]